MVLDWTAAEGASVYTVTAAGDLGYVASFQTNETSAEAELPCGQLFTFTLVAQDDRCDSATSLPEEFKTGESATRFFCLFTFVSSQGWLFYFSL